MAKNESNIKKLLTSVVERIERLEEEKSGLGVDIREIYAEAKGNGLDSKTIREVIKLRKVDAAKRDEQEYLRDQYLKALGLISQEE